MTADERTAARVHELERRTDALESLLLRGWCFVVAALLVAGLLVPYGHEGLDDDRTTWSVLTTPFVALNDGTDGLEGSDLTLGILYLGGFVGLILVALGLLGGLVIIGGRAACTRAPRVLRVLVVLAVVGSVVVLLLTGMIANLDRGEGGPGGLVLLAGALAFVPLLTARGRSLWADR
ncbi:hypothetical protein [Pseudactinotalea suaedae]|uniref:hypothetical protein n=1 Tax=Pseudactinotalea suaedae TaxID=1524924 RepID=UPI0012E22781|nr:hypothetical protein [Pseudactinotalea suaedae]